MRLILHKVGPLWLSSLLLTTGTVGSAAAASIEVAPAVSYSVVDARSQTFEPVLAIRARFMDECALVAKTAVMRYAEPGILDARYVTPGIGLEGSAGLKGRFRLVGDIIPGLTLARWHQRGINNKEAKVSISFGAGIRSPLSGELGMRTMLWRYLSGGSRPIFFTDGGGHFPQPGVADTRVEVSLEYRL